MDECEAKAEKTLTKVANDLNLETSKSVKLESNGQIGYYFRVTLKDEKNLRNNRNYHTIDTNKNGVRFRNTALEDVNETYLRVRREYDQQQQSVVKEILSVAGRDLIYQMISKPSNFVLCLQLDTSIRSSI